MLKSWTAQRRNSSRIRYWFTAVGASAYAKSLTLRVIKDATPSFLHSSRGTRFDERALALYDQCSTRRASEIRMAAYEYREVRLNNLKFLGLHGSWAWAKTLPPSQSGCRDDREAIVKQLLHGKARSKFGCTRRCVGFEK